MFKLDRRGFSAPIIILALVVLTAIIAASVIVVRNRNEKTPSASAVAPASTTPAQDAAIPVRDTSDEPKDVITTVDITLKTPGDEEMLPSAAPESFVSYLKDKLAAFDCDFSEYPEGSYRVKKLSKNFAAGSVVCGGGAATIWYFEAGAWQELGYQSSVPCKDLVMHKIPSDFLGLCYDETTPDTLQPNPNGPLNAD